VDIRILFLLLGALALIFTVYTVFLLVYSVIDAIRMRIRSKDDKAE
jgi:hypothetical protein